MEQKSSIPSGSSKKKVAVVGSTGSIGRQTLDVIGMLPEQFEAVALTVNSDVAALKEQYRQHRPRVIGIASQTAARENAFVSAADVYVGEEANAAVAALREVDIVVIAMSGMQAVHPLLAAIRAGKKIAIANKESIVCAGPVIKRALREHPDALLIPVDSEQSAIFQCLSALPDKGQADKLILTASGGPMLHTRAVDFPNVTPEMALCHPNWEMGRKITVDTATMANKGLELIEAHYLFDIPEERIDVLIHTQSVVHSLVQTVDGSMLAQLSIPDMRVPIQYALCYPDRMASPLRPLDLSQVSNLSFARMDTRKYRALRLARQALRASGTATAVFDAANESAVEAFLDRQLGFHQIPDVIENALGAVPSQPADSLDAVIEAVSRAKLASQRYLETRR